MDKCISDNLLLQYLLNDLDTDTCELVRAHLNECPSCQKRTEIYSEDSELKQWQECHLRSQNGDDSKNHPFSQDKLDRLFNSTVSSIQQSKTTVAKSVRPSSHNSSILLRKEPEPPPIRVIGQYQLIKKIGQGGMGVVYESVHSRLKKQVVLKLLLNKDWENTDQTQRFYREMELIGQLDHPNIVKATDAGEADDTCFLVMEYLDGHDLKTILKQEGPLSITAACSILRQAANGLQYIHNHDLIHRDIKPSNLFLTTDGQVKILDLGLAGLRHAGSSLDDLTDTNCIMGSAYYMAPEQAQSIKTIDQRSDIYSLGCTFYQLLTGQVPFRRETPVETIIAHREDSVPRLADQLPEIPVLLEELFQSMAKKNPDDRIQTMAEVVKILDEFLNQKSELPLNETSDTYLTESQELKELCLKTVLTPPVEAQKYYSSTQYQPTQRILKYKKIIIIASIIIMTGILTLGIQYISRTNHTTNTKLKSSTAIPNDRQPEKENPKSIPAPGLTSTQAKIERDVANWALDHGCEINIVVPYGEEYPTIEQKKSLPNEDFYVKIIAFKKIQMITQEKLSRLSGLTNLYELQLNDNPIEDDALAAVSGLTSLQKLDLHASGITDKGLSHISNLKNLTNLSLQINSNITDEGLQVINQLKNLVSLNLAKTNISDEGLIFIQNNQKIDWLNIEGTKVSDESVKHLKKLILLEHLFVKGSKISKAGIKEINDFFKKRNHLPFYINPTP
ncbi:serine/threonine-protein kinase [Gimesia aquarii]|uniref:Serine/threonine-protein kinase PknB n=1 Tax=Gimesia aquarii TaxID=2527964 RepID=A0A517W0J4_9PLAN|nr:serine/threonine-protein kinase [Gimesia aquarii]QDT98769.1 Serine/threonine-protein kinase PknB [Gimesia aquarii]